MDTEPETGDAFSIPDFSRATFFTSLQDDNDDDSSPLFPHLIVHDGSEQLDQGLLLTLDKGLSFKGAFETLESFGLEGPTELNALPDASVVSSSSIFSEELSKDDVQQDVEDVWKLSAITDDVRLDTVPDYSWDAFLQPTFRETFPALLSEAGSRTLDAALALKSLDRGGTESAPVVLQQDFVVQCLAALALGRGSAVFQYDDDDKTFFGVTQACRASGFSSETMESSCARFFECGNAFKFLQDFVEETYGNRKALPALIAVAEGVSTGLLALETHISARQGTVQSILQLQSLFQTPHVILECFKDLVTTLQSANDEVDVLSRLYHKLATIESGSTTLNKIVFEMLRRISRPWLESVEGWLGLRPRMSRSLARHDAPDLFGKALQHMSDERESDLLEGEKLSTSGMTPEFITNDDTRMIYESGKSLRFLESHDTGHPLLCGDVSRSFHPPRLEWGLSWEALERIEASAKSYEQNVAAAIRHFKPRDAVESEPGTSQADSSEESDVFGQSEAEIGAHLHRSAALIGQNIDFEDRDVGDKLRDVILKELDTDTCYSSHPSKFAPPLSLSSILSFHPIVSAQARIINTATLRLFFQKYHLRTHISLQRRFQLLGDGNFVSRLSHALFDKEVESAERKQGVSRSGGPVGLNIGGRDSWPPASSELRLALMGILTETYNATAPVTKRGGWHGHGDDIPGGLSFAIRDLSEDELQQCMDPDSLAALDFLKLEYKPPPPLDAVISPSCLRKYDRLFKLFLRLLRLLFTVNELHRDAGRYGNAWRDLDPVAQRFRIEAHHFVSTLYGYFIEAGVGIAWAQLEARLDAIGTQLGSDDAASLVGHTDSIDRLREYHEEILDKILYATFLRKRQAQVMALLEDLLLIILSFAKLMRAGDADSSSRSEHNKEVRSLYARFKKRAGVFVGVCKGLSEKRGPGKKSKGEDTISSIGVKNDDSENPVGILFLRLDMNGYYS